MPCPPLSPDARRRLKAALPTANAARRLFAEARVSTDREALERLRRELLERYERLVATIGPIRASLPLLAAADQIFLTLAHAERKVQGRWTLGPLETVPLGRAALADQLPVAPEVAMALAVLHRGVLDPDWIAQLTDRPWADIVREAEGVHLFRDHADPERWVPRWQYLTGDVVTALHEARQLAARDPRYLPNVAALEAVQPPGRIAEEIDAAFGVSWVDTGLYEAYLAARGVDARVQRVSSPAGLVYSVTVRTGRHPLDPGLTRPEVWIEDALNQRAREIHLPGSKDVDPERTAAYAESVARLREDWELWWRATPAARTAIVTAYNQKFRRWHTERPRVTDRSLRLPGQAPGVLLYRHQIQSILELVSRGGGLVGKGVGSGKTRILAGTALTWVRAGYVERPIIAVPSRLLEPFLEETLAVWPDARVLVHRAGGGPAGRRLTRDLWRQFQYDFLLISHSQLGRFPPSPDEVAATRAAWEQGLLRAARQVAPGLDLEALEDPPALAPPTVRQVAKQLQALRRILAALEEAGATAVRQQEPLFSDLEADALLIDEAHAFKNLWAPSSVGRTIRRAAISPSQRALHLLLVIDRVRARNRHKRGIVLATGTPITRSFAEVLTWLRYLSPEVLEQTGLVNLDSFLATFAQIDWEHFERAPESGAWRRVATIVGWRNLGLLKDLLVQQATVSTAADLRAIDPEMPAPPAATRHIVALEPSARQREVFQQIRDELRRSRHEPGAALRALTRFRLAAIDPALLDRTIPPDFHGGRLGAVARKVAAIARADPEAFQMVFLDVGVPRTPGRWAPETDEADEVAQDARAEDEAEADAEAAQAWREAEAAWQAAGLVDRDLYTPLKQAIVRLARLHPTQVVFLHHVPESQMAAFADAVRRGRVRVLLASRAKGGLGLNVQQTFKAVHHVDVPWNPDWLEQSEGRALRPGNRYATVDVYRYVTKGSLDDWSWELVSLKQELIRDFLYGVGGSRADEPMELASSYREVMAAAIDDPRVYELLDVKRRVDKTVRQLAFASYQEEQAAREQRAVAVRLEYLTRLADDLADARAAVGAWWARGGPATIGPGARPIALARDEAAAALEEMKARVAQLGAGAVLAVLDAPLSEAGPGWIVRVTASVAPSGTGSTWVLTLARRHGGGPALLDHPSRFPGPGPAAPLAWIRRILDPDRIAAEEEGRVARQLDELRREAEAVAARVGQRAPDIERLRSELAALEARRASLERELEALVGEGGS